MNKKKFGLLALSLVLIATIGVGATLAYFTEADAATNTITMGHVDIDLDEPNYDPDDDDDTVEDIVPGQVITKDPTITVQEGSLDAYIRATITLSDNLTADQAEELMAGITILDGWYYSNPEENGDGYYYYKNVVTAGSSVKLFEEVKIPEKWGNEVADMTFTIDVAAEAIQADSFTPQTNADGYVTAWTYEDGTAVTAETYEAKTAAEAE